MVQMCGVANGGMNAKFSSEINNDEFLDPLSTIKNKRLINVNRVVTGNLNINSLPNKFSQPCGYFGPHRNKVRRFFSKFSVFS